MNNNHNPHRDDSSWVTCNGISHNSGPKEFDDTGKESFDMKKWLVRNM